MSRETVAVGRIAQGETRLAVKCAWGPPGGHFFTVDAVERAYQNGALLTHGICPEHAAEMEAALDAMPDPAA